MTTAATTSDEVDQAVAAAAAATPRWAALDRATRAGVLRRIADHLDDAADSLVPIAQRETHLAEGRLRGELKRTTFQLRLFAEVVEDGAYLDARVDHADPGWPMGAPRPDLRRQLEPLGPVLVFAASNFPFAFSVAGGDTAAALAAGCPVLVKVHSGHPELSVATGEVVQAALVAANVPAGVFGLLVGSAAGVRALEAPAIQAGAFTGSIAGGRALFDIAAARPQPIPFYGELGSLNPAFVTTAAAAARSETIAAEFVASFTLGAGQFCTKPGVLLVPAGSDVVERLRTTTLPGAAPLLNDRISQGYADTLAELAAHPAVSPLAGPTGSAGDAPEPTLLLTRASDLLADPDGLLRECFGPTAVVATYEQESELLDVAATLEGQLTATIVGEDEDEIAPALIRALAGKAGRVLWNGWPTGVSVTYAQQHGGPYPATTAPTSTSVGTAAISRFLRPVAYQGFPQHLLPDGLRDGAELPQRVDGRLVPSAEAGRR